MARSEIFEVAAEGLEVWIEYNANNMRIGGAFWTVPPGVVARVKVWDSGALVVDQEISGNSSSNISGNYRMEIGPDGLLGLPANLVYRFEAEIPALGAP